MAKANIVPFCASNPNLVVSTRGASCGSLWPAEIFALESWRFFSRSSSGHFPEAESSQLCVFDWEVVAFSGTRDIGTFSRAGVEGIDLECVLFPQPIVRTPFYRAVNVAINNNIVLIHSHRASGTF